MTISNELMNYGWNEYFESNFEDLKGKYNVGRVLVEYKGLYKLYTLDGEILGNVSGKMKHLALRKDDYPKVGDWVVIDKNKVNSGNTVIYDILPRKSKFSRKEAGQVIEEQIIAVNIDTIFICMSLNEDFNIRRLERYLTMVWNNGINPVVILTKSDLSDDIESKIIEVENVAFGVDIIVTSAKDNKGLDDLYKYVNKGKTVAFLGSSGVGKSTLVNHLLKEEKLKTQEIREDDDKGKHTTTHRELVLLPEGGLVMDTPGMREFQILDAEDGIEVAFDDIEEIALTCKFSDCNHKSEPGCAVKEAIRNGSLEEKRFKNYLKLQREARYIANKLKQKERQENKRNKTK